MKSKILAVFLMAAYVIVFVNSCSIQGSVEPENVYEVIKMERMVQ